MAQSTDTPPLSFDSVRPKRKPFFSLLQRHENQVSLSSLGKEYKTKGTNQNRHLCIDSRNHRMSQRTEFGEINDEQKKLKHKECSAVFYGVPINGFHPQSTSIPNNYVYQSDFLLSRKRKLYSNLNGIVNQLRVEEENEISRKRKKLSCSHVNTGNCDTQDEITTHKEHTKKNKYANVLNQVKVIESHINETISSNTYRSSFQLSNVPQLIANSDGQVVAWNNSFLKVTGFSRSRMTSYLSVFDMVDHSFLPRLLDMFSYVLRHDGFPCINTAGNIANDSIKIPLEQEISDSNYRLNHGASEEFKLPPTRTNGSEQGVDRPSYENSCSSPAKCDHSHKALVAPLSCTMFCKTNHFSSNFHYIKIRFMDDQNPIRRCFHCVLYAKEHGDCDLLRSKNK